MRRIDPTQLQILDDHRWAAPLDDMILRVLSAELAARLPAGAVAGPSEAATSEARQSVALDIRDFYADARCAVALRAAWVIKAPATQAGPEPRTSICPRMRAAPAWPHCRRDEPGTGAVE